MGRGELTGSGFVPTEGANPGGAEVAGGGEEGLETLAQVGGGGSAPQPRRPPPPWERTRTRSRTWRRGGPRSAPCGASGRPEPHPRETRSLVPGRSSRPRRTPSPALDGFGALSSTFLPAPARGRTRRRTEGSNGTSRPGSPPRGAHRGRRRRATAGGSGEFNLPARLPQQNAQESHRCCGAGGAGGLGDAEPSGFEPQLGLSAPRRAAAHQVAWPPSSPSTAIERVRTKALCCGDPSNLGGAMRKSTTRTSRCVMNSGYKSEGDLFLFDQL